MLRRCFVFLTDSPPFIDFVLYPGTWPSYLTNLLSLRLIGGTVICPTYLTNFLSLGLVGAAEVCPTYLTDLLSLELVGAVVV